MNPAMVLAFGAGAASAFSPCGIAMLPATIALLSGRADTGAGLGERAWRGGMAGILLALGFSLMVAVAALLFSLVAHALFHVLPYLMVVLAAALVAMGVLMYLDRLAIGLSTGTLARRVDALGAGFVGTLVAAGAAYGLAALSCTLPMFIALLADVAGRGAGGTVGVVVMFAVGVSLVLVAVSIGTALWRGAMDRAIHTVLPYIGRVSGAIVVAAGVWIAYYWLLGPGHWLV
jgi:cytochrome c biogenesis protein CcdA